MSPRELSLRLPHLELAALAWGDPALPPLLAVHGWLDNAASFTALAPQLAQHFHVVALDWPGHGRSQHRPPGSWYHYVDYGDELFGAAAALGWERFTLLGHSLGGAVASVFAAVHPQRVERLLLIEALGPLSGAPEKALDHLRSAYTQREAFREKSLRVFASLDEAIDARLTANDYLSRAAARQLVERGVRRVPDGWSWSSDPRLTLASPLRFTEVQVHAALRGIAAPSLLLLADPATSYLPREVMDARGACVADLRVQRLPGHHHLHLDDAARVAAAIEGFLQGPT
ncbi:MAG: alpha/beta hydrolase [Lysobacterales bacterium]